MIKEIKDRSKLQEMLRSAMNERDYYYNCIEKTAQELLKHTYSWDGKPKNLEVYAYALNKKYEELYDCLQGVKKIAEGVKVYDPLAKYILQIITKAERIL